MIVADGPGGAITGWNDSRDDTNDINAQRVDADGNILWPIDGVPVCVFTTNAVGVCLASGDQVAPAPALVTNSLRDSQYRSCADAGTRTNVVAIGEASA
jgi:hypothetical protein